MICASYRLRRISLPWVSTITLLCILLKFQICSSHLGLNLSKLISNTEQSRNPISCFALWTTKLSHTICKHNTSVFCVCKYFSCEYSFFLINPEKLCFIFSCPTADHRHQHNLRVFTWKECWLLSCDLIFLEKMCYAHSQTDTESAESPRPHHPASRVDKSPRCCFFCPLDSVPWSCWSHMFFLITRFFPTLTG